MTGRIQKVGICCLGTGGPGTGLDVYLRHVIRAFRSASRLFDAEFVCTEGQTVRLDLENSGGKTHVLDSGTGALPELLALHRNLPRLARERNWDLFFAPVSRRLPLNMPCPTMVAVHDIAAFAVKHKYGLLRGMFHRSVLPLIYSRADAVLVGSEQTRRDLLRFTRVPRDRIHLIPLGVETSAFDPEVMPTDGQTLRDLGVTRPYILYTSRLEHPGKNHVALLGAFRALLDAGRDLDLVLVGRPWRGSHRILRRIERLGLKDRVVLAGFVDSDALAALYRSAELFVFPSLYEGFGLPVLEAMSAGAPVACARASSLPEVAADAALYFDPHSVEEMTSVLQDLLGSRELRDRLRARGMIRSAQFPWSRTRERIITLARDLLGVQCELDARAPLEAGVTL